MAKSELEKLEALTRAADQAAGNAADQAPGPATDQAPGQAPPGEGGTPPADPRQELAGIVQTVAGMLTPAFPSLEKIYTRETCLAIAGATVPVLDKYGISVAGLLGRYAAELTCVAVVGPVALATWHGIREDLAKREREAKRQAPANKAPAEGAQPPGDGQPVPTPGALVLQRG